MKLKPLTQALLAYILLPIALFGGERERTKQINLIQNWIPDRNDQGFVQGGMLGHIYETLKLKNTSLKATDLTNEKDSRELSYVVMYNQCCSVNSTILDKFPLNKRILFMWEPPVVQKDMYTDKFLSKFKRVYTWNDSLVDNNKFFKFYYPELKSMLPHLPTFEERKLLTQISGRKRSKHQKELYSERVAVIQFFETLPEGDFEFYGIGWEKDGYRTYQGMTPNKLETLKNYRFSVCYENMCDVQGYITEKIFDCFAAGTVPIYWGASNVTDFIPKECFIDRRDFGSFKEVYDYVKKMDSETYQTYVNNIKKFVESDEAKLFSEEMFKVIFLEAVRFP